MDESHFTFMVLRYSLRKDNGRRHLVIRGGIKELSSPFWLTTKPFLFHHFSAASFFFSQPAIISNYLAINELLWSVRKVLRVLFYPQPKMWVRATCAQRRAPRRLSISKIKKRHVTSMAVVWTHKNTGSTLMYFIQTPSLWSVKMLNKDNYILDKMNSSYLEITWRKTSRPPFFFQVSFSSLNSPAWTYLSRTENINVFFFCFFFFLATFFPHGCKLTSTMKFRYGESYNEAGLSMNSHCYNSELTEHTSGISSEVLLIHTYITSVEHYALVFQGF